MHNNVCADFSSGEAVIEDAMPKGLQSLQRTIDTDVKIKEGALQFSFALGEMQYDMPLDLHMPWSLCLPWKIFVPFKTWLLLKKLITSWVLGKDTFKISTKLAVLSLKMWSNYWAKMWHWCVTHFPNGDSQLAELCKESKSERQQVWLSTTADDRKFGKYSPENYSKL